MSETPRYSRYRLPGEGWKTYKKKQYTRALRIEGPFSCVTIDGEEVTCKDGYLAIDSHGHPYPIARHEMDAIYEEITEHGAA
jgi:hypothetical protein